MQRREFIRLTGAAGVSVALAGCFGDGGDGGSDGSDGSGGSDGDSGDGGDGGGDDGASTGGGASPVTIGVLGPKSGPLSRLNSFYTANIELAVDQINGGGNFVHDGGGLNVGGSTREVEYVYYDTESKPNVGASAAERLIEQDGVSVVLGAMSSTTTLAIMDVLEREEVPGVTSVSVNEKITGEEGNQWFFRNKDTDSMRAKFISQAIADEVGFDSVGMIGPNNDFGIGRMDAFADALGERGVETLTKQSFNQEAQSFLSELESIKAEEPDALYMVLNDPTHGVQMVPQASQVGFDNMIGTGPLGTPQTPEKVGDPLGGTYIEITFPNEAKGTVDHVTTWANDLEEATDGEVPPNYIGAPTYDAVNAIADSIGRAGEVAPGPIRDAMAGTSVLGVYPYPDFALEFDGNNQAQVVAGLGQWQKQDGEWRLTVQTGPFASN
jgi:branched-chain amino acid transport system substrate-binding protein